MKPDLMEILACPVCKGALELTVDLEKDGEILTGTLRCSACDEDYPIEDSIPNLLPPRHPDAAHCRVRITPRESARPTCERPPVPERPRADLRP